MKTKSDVGEKLYIELLKRSLSGYLNHEMGMRLSYVLNCMESSQPSLLQHVKNIAESEPEKFQSLMEDANGQQNYRERIYGFPATMIGKARLDNIEMCVRVIVSEGIAGDLMETGVWRGGATIFMRGMLKILGNNDKNVWVVDSFQGLPEPELEQDEGINYHLDPMLSVDLETVKRNFEYFDLLDDRVQFLQGWFADTMATAPVEKLSLLRLDGDLYKSTMDVLEPIYDKVEPGGFIIIDDYGAIPACKQAVHDFRESRGITEPIETIDWTGRYWRKG
jgi:O-methyltransferase